MDMIKSQPTRFTIEEGGKWFPWAARKDHRIIFAVEFEDGSIFDAIAGWRNLK
jgi:hypothetical protein